MPRSIRSKQNTNDGAMNSAGSGIFGFESDLERSRACIPMAVRFKLDQCAMKLSLAQRRQLLVADRRDLLEMRCETDLEVADFRRAIEKLVKGTTGDYGRSRRLSLRSSV